MMCNDHMTNSSSPVANGESSALVKIIGKTTYVVRVHFSTTSKETMNDKIKRMLQKDGRQNLK